MVSYQTTVLKFGEQGEKTGWTYIEIPASIAEQLKPGYKQSYRVKGKLDNCPIKAVAILPMGEGNFIMPLNAEMRKKTGKKRGDKIGVSIEEDKAPFQFNADLIACLEDEPEAMRFFKSLPGSHQRYFSKWIDSAKSETTIAKRIALTVNAMLKGQNFGEMMREMKKENERMRE